MNMEIEAIRPRFRPSAEREALKKALRSVALNETISYVALSKAVGVNVLKGNIRSKLTAARDDLLKDGFVFDAVRGVGLMRLDGKTIIRHGTKMARKLLSELSRLTAKEEMPIRSPPPSKCQGPPLSETLKALMTSMKNDCPRRKES